MDLSLMIRFIMVIMVMGDGGMNTDYENNWFDQLGRGHFGSDRYNPATGLYKQYDWETQAEAKLRHQRHLESCYYGYGLWSEEI